MPRKYCACIALLAALTVHSTAGAVREERIDPVPVAQRIAARVAQGDLPGAEALIDDQLSRTPRDPLLLFNAACVQCRLNQPDRAAGLLLDAVKAGFDDFHQIRRDPDLEPIRTHQNYLSILRAREFADRVLGEWALGQWRRQHRDSGYRYVSDAARRLHFAFALDDAAMDQTRATLDNLSDHLAATMFGSAQKDPIFIAIATPADAGALFRSRHAEGVYEHPRRRLVVRSTGRALRHEFVHVLHHGQMDRLLQRHPIWIQEGLASLYEDYELRGDGSVRFIANDRDAIAQHLAKRDRLMSWSMLVHLSDREFEAQAALLYPQVRSMMEFLAERGLLQGWYAAFVGHFDDDPSGVKSLEQAFDMPLDQIEAQWRQWLMARPIQMTGSSVRLESTDHGHAGAWIQ